MSPRPCPSCSLPFLALPMHGMWECSQRSAEILGSVVMGRWVILRGQPGTSWRGECLGMHWSGRSSPVSLLSKLTDKDWGCSQLKDLKSSLSATTWRITVSPSTRHLHCLTHHNSNWSSHWMNSTTGWHFSSRCSPAGWRHYQNFSCASFYRSVCCSLSTTQHLTFFTVKLSSKWAISTCRPVTKDHTGELQRGIYLFNYK